MQIEVDFQHEIQPICERCGESPMPAMCFLCDVQDCPLRPTDEASLKFRDEFRSPGGAK